MVLVWSAAVAYPSSTSGHVAYAALTLALLGLAATVPTLAAAVVSGTIADRVDRRRLMQATNATALIGAAGLLLTTTLDPSLTVALPGPNGYYLPLWLLLALPAWAAISASATIFRPGFNAMLPRLLPPADLGPANGLIYGLAVATSVGGSLAATAALMLLSIQVALLVPLALFLVTGAAVAFLPSMPPQPTAGPRTRFSADIVAGYGYLYRNRPILKITVSALAINFLSALAFVELGLYVRDWLGVGQAILLGAMITGATVGSGVGTIVVGRIGFERMAGRYLILLTILQGFAVIALAFSRSIAISIPLMFLFGLFPGMSQIVFLATIQAVVPNPLLGRVLAADEVGSYGMVPVGQYAGGILTLFAGVQATYLVAGAGTVAVGAAMATFRDLRALGFDPKARNPPAGEVAAPA